MRNDETALAPADSPGDRRLPSQGFARRLLAWALHGPPWSYVVLIVAGLAAALLVAGLRG